MKYPKLLLFTVSCILAYVLFAAGVFDVIPSLFHGYGYLSMFIGGILFTFGFTTAFGIAILIEMAPSVHPLSGALIGGLGAMLADETIFQFVKGSLHDELHELSSHQFFKWIRSHMSWYKHLSERLRTYLLWSFAGLIIASPLPDELGVTLLSSIGEVKAKYFIPLSFVFNTAGIFLMLMAAS